MAVKERQSNIELLRLIAIVGIIILHYNHADMGGGFRYVASGSLNENILVFLESVAICGVNLFVMISGYFLSRTNTRSVGKVIILLIQVCLYGLINYVILAAIGRIPFRIKGMIYSMIPLNWFVTLYIVLYLISPLINRAFQNLKSRNVLIGLVFLFGFVPTMLDVISQVKSIDTSSLMTLGTNGSGRGYTIISFILCYIIGATFNWIRIEKISVWAAGLILLADIIGIFFWAKWNRSTAWEYCNPLILLEAMLFILLFLKIRMGFNRVINLISGCTFSVFLIHLYIVPYLRVEQFVQKSAYIMLAHLILSCLAIVIFSFVVDQIYHICLNWMIKRVSRIWTYTI